MEPKNYKIRCDKHVFKPYVYCEMCMIRTQLQETIEENRKTVESACASMNVALNVVYDLLENQKKKIDIIKGTLKI